MAAAAGVKNAHRKPDLDVLKESARQKLIELLDLIRGTKDVVIDSELLPVLEIIAGARLLKQHGVDKIFRLENNFVSGNNKKRIYLIYPHIKKVKVIADHINAAKTHENKQPLTVDVVMVPRKLYFCEEVLEYEGIFGDISVRSLDLGFIPIQHDVLSLEFPWFNRDLFLFKDQVWMYSIASALHTIRCHFGDIPNVYAHGPNTKLVLDMMKDIFDQAHDKIKAASEIGHLFIFERTVDYPSALLSQLTYEGQLDETFSIQNGYVTLNQQDTARKEVEIKLKLSSDDPIFQEIRDTHIIKAFEILSQKVKKMVASSKKRQEMSVNEMKEFITTQLKIQQEEHKSISQHISACEIIFKRNMIDQVQEKMAIERNIIEGISYKETIHFIEENIILKAPIEQNLRLLCLLSLTQDGLPSKDYKHLQSKFLQSYGYQHLLTFYNLKQMGLLIEQESKTLPPLTATFVEKMASATAYRVGGSTFQTYSKKLNLIPKPDCDYDAKNPTDPAYVFGGVYVPLACSVVVQALDKVSGLEDTLKTVLGNSYWNEKATSARGTGGNASSDIRIPSPRVVLVFFIGGITLVEIAAFRLLEILKGYRIILATTSVVNGKTIVQNAMEDLKLK